MEPSISLISWEIRSVSSMFGKGYRVGRPWALDDGVRPKGRRAVALGRSRSSSLPGLGPSGI